MTSTSINELNRYIEESIEQARSDTDLETSTNASEANMNDHSRLTTEGQSDSSFDDVVDLEPSPEIAQNNSGASLHPLQEWEGYVVEIDGNEFVAHLIDLTSADAPFEIEEAVIPMEEISKHDKDRMQIGSIFRWVIGYEQSVAGTRGCISQIVFRDLPTTDADLELGDAWARKIIESFVE